MKKRSKIGRKMAAADRISDLPESIIHDRIMSRLSRRDRARTRVLSKTWYLLNKTYPALDFDFDCFFQKENSDSPEYKKCLKSFTKRAYKSLLRFSRKKLRLRSLRINFTDGRLDDSCVLDRWIGLGLESRIEKLKLYCSPFMSQEYSLPRPVNFSTTLTSLKLEHCVLDQPLSLFTSLRKLTLLNCQLNDGQLVLENSDCPALESLTLWYCLGFDTVRISNLVQLDRVVLEFDVPLAVEIASQSVQKLVIVDFSDQCPWSEEISIYGCSCLTFLYLNSDTIADQELHHLLAQLPLLEELSVFGCCQLKAMQVSSPRLKTLVVAPNYLSGLTSIDIEVPTLKNLMFISDISRTEKTEIKVQEDCLETLVLCSADMRDKQFNKLITKFPALQNLWIYGCYELQKIRIPNRQLRRLHVARCSRLKDVRVGSCELVEMYCSRGCEDLKVSVPPDIDRMFATGALRCDLMADCKSPFWPDSLHEMLMSLVQEKSLAELIVRNCCDF